MAELLVDVVIPARDAEATVAGVVRALPAALVRDVYVVDRASDDDTAGAAVEAGARLLTAPRGLGAACARALDHLTALERPPDVVAFVAADGSAEAAELSLVLAPLRACAADLVLGARMGGLRVGERLVALAIRVLYRKRYRDVPPLRAIRLPALVALALRDQGSGWPVEMQVKAATARLRVVEVPVRYRRGARRPLGARLCESASRSLRALATITRFATAR